MKTQTIVLATLSLLAAGAADADNYWWHGRADNDWFNLTNWNSGTDTNTPTSSDYVYFSRNDMSADAQLDLGSEAQSVNGLYIAGQDCSVILTNGTLTSAYLYIGSAEWWGTYTGSLVLRGGTLNSGHTIYVGNGSVAELEVDGGTLNSESAICVAPKKGVAATMTVKSGSVIAAGEIDIGGRGPGVVTMTGGRVECTNVKLNGWSGDADTDDYNVAEGTTFNFNGGTLVTKQICGANGVSPVLNWNGGTLQLPEGNVWDDVLKRENGTDFQVNVLSGGAIVDTAGTNSAFYVAVSGVGQLVKRGAGRALPAA